MRRINRPGAILISGLSELSAQRERNKKPPAMRIMQRKTIT